MMREGGIMNDRVTSLADCSAQGWIEEAARLESLAERFRGHPFLGASFAALARDARLMSRARTGGFGGANLQPSTAVV
jgi:hypothetical protein